MFHILGEVGAELSSVYFRLTYLLTTSEGIVNCGQTLILQTEKVGAS